MSKIVLWPAFKKEQEKGLIEMYFCKNDVSVMAAEWTLLDNALKESTAIPFTAYRLDSDL